MKRHGTDVATALVAGTIAYLLSLPDIGATLREDTVEISQRLKDYVKNFASYERLDSDVPAI